MSLTTVLFDLDGTLLPMDMDTFTTAYFKGISAKAAPLGYAPQGIVAAIWSGIKAMVKNGGGRTNEEIFWETFAGIYGKDALKDRAAFDEFYRVDFNALKDSCGYDPRARRVVDLCKEKGLRVALATNPIFPRIATESRIAWAGLEPRDFERVTVYENSHTCKPNPEYYREVVNSLGVSPEECLMVGNDVEEDMIAETLGMKVFLITDCLINKNRKDISSYDRGGFDELISFINDL